MTKCKLAECAAQGKHHYEFALRPPFPSWLTLKRDLGAWRISARISMGDPAYRLNDKEQVKTAAPFLCCGTYAGPAALWWATEGQGNTSACTQHFSCV